MSNLKGAYKEECFPLYNSVSSGETSGEVKEVNMESYFLLTIETGAWCPMVVTNTSSKNISYNLLNQNISYFGLEEALVM